MKKYLVMLFVIVISQIGKSQTCPDYGSASNQRLKILNVLKNREIVESKIDKSVTIDSILKFGNDTGRFSDNKYICVVGYCVLAKWGGPESCNCKTDDKSQWDIHLVISSDSNISNQDSCIIVEITRKYRNLHDPIKPSDFVNHKLSISGYMFRDDEHLGESINTTTTGTKHCFRKTSWEIHPVVKIEILE